MNINAVFFSPTGTTKKIVMTVAGALGELKEIDITSPKARQQTYEFGPEDLVIFGVPTYAGKVPNKLLPCIEEGFRGNGGKAVALATYGNRSFDNSLVELTSLLKERGFQVIGGGAFVCRHAFSDNLAFGRPDFFDEADMDKLAQAIKTKVLAEDWSCPEIPGDPDAPYYVPKGVDGRPAKFLKAKPKVELDKCSGCGACSRICPMGAIDPQDSSLVPGTCIKCQACIRRCMRAARYFDDPAFLSHVRMLEENYTDRKENYIYL